MNVNELMAQAAKAFQTKTRDNGERFTCLCDAAPEWLSDDISTIHGTDMFPDDWRYGVIAGAARDLADIDSSEWEDSVFEVADAYADDYTGPALAWLTPSRVEDVNEALREFGTNDLINAIACAQQNEARAIIERLIEVVNTQCEE